MHHHLILKRSGILLIGLLINALGISLITKSGLGTPPITSLPYVLTFIFPLSLGVFTFMINMLMIIGQIAILKKNFKKIQYLQIIVTLIFSFFIDFFVLLFSDFYPHNYMLRLFILVLGCVTLGLGISLEVLSGLVYLPGEGIVQAIAFSLGRMFGTIKTLFDISIVFSAMTISILCLGNLTGLREGTIISALTVGMISRFFIRRLRLIIPTQVTENKS